MNHLHLSRTLEAALAELDVIDIHTHLVGGRLGARGLHDILLYHMVITELYSAGCPSGARLSEFPSWATKAEAEARITEALPYLQHIRNTGTSWGLRIVLADLYDWREAITVDNWRRLDAIIRERADDRAWHHNILDRLRIRRSCTEWARRGEGVDDNRLQYAVEWAMFMRCQWGEYDTAVYELERTWGRPPESPTPIGAGKRSEPARRITSVADIHAAMREYVQKIAAIPVVSHAYGISCDIDNQPVSDDEMTAALARRGQAGERERSIYAAYVNEAFLSEMERQGVGRIVVQFSYAAEAMPFETASRVTQRSIAQVAEMIARHPKLHFQAFLASRHAHQSLCTMCRELPNFSIVGFWWHNFFPSTIQQVFAERLDMVPLNRQVAFFSDAYCVDWTYGKLMLVRKQMANVLAAKIEQGQFSFDEAVSIARTLLFESPQTLSGMSPRTEENSHVRS